MALAAGISASTGWEPTLHDFQAEVVMWIHSDRLLLGLALSPRGVAVTGAARLLSSARKAAVEPIKPSLAYAMVTAGVSLQKHLAEVAHTCSLFL
jgi:hypothetical protein